MCIRDRYCTSPYLNGISGTLNDRSTCEYQKIAVSDTIQWLFDTSINEAGCEDKKGNYFNGQISGIQFFIDGVTISNINSESSAVQEGLYVLTGSGDIDVLGLSLAGNYISSGEYPNFLSLDYNGWLDSE